MLDNNPGESRKKLKVDLTELVSEMEMGDNLELSGYLDTETGEIISMPDNVMRAVEDSDEASLRYRRLWQDNYFPLCSYRTSGYRSNFFPISASWSASQIICFAFSTVTRSRSSPTGSSIPFRSSLVLMSFTART